jgi:cyclopropane fatty-acyl-phospholipid synthase-like methyltransferase
MRYGTIPKGLKEYLADFLGVVPHPMLDVLVAPLQARALIAAERASVFRMLGEGSATTAEAARRLNLDESCLDLVLRLLSSMGYVKRRGGLWSLSRLGQKHFGPKAPNPFANFVAFGAPQWEWISQLDEVLRTGRGVLIHQTLHGSDWGLYQRAMAEGARDFAEFVAKKLPVRRGARLCLDIAGSHGLVGAALCRAHPGLQSVVLERAEAIPEARLLAEKAGVADVVSFREADVLKDDYGEGADVVVLANILHHFSPEVNLQILGRARRALASGGSIGIFDIEAPGRDRPPEAAGDAAALFFRITSNSACFSGADYTSWLSRTGFSGVRVERSPLLPSRLLVVATAP